jgi:hypothetical protein
MFGYQLISSMTRFNLIQDDSGNNEGEYLVEVLGKDDNPIDQMSVENEDGVITTKSAVNFILRAFVHHPLQVVDSWVINYLGLINIFGTNSPDGIGYWIADKNINLKGCVENCAIATSILEHKSNIYYMPENMYQRVVDYEQYIDPPFLVRKILEVSKGPSIVLLNTILLILPFVLLFVIIYMICMRNKFSKSNREIMILVVILLIYSFLHLIAHALTGAIIDRYSSPVYITTILGYLALTSVFYSEYKNHKNYCFRLKKRS